MYCLCVMVQINSIKNGIKLLPPSTSCIYLPVLPELSPESFFWSYSQRYPSMQWGQHVHDSPLQYCIVSVGFTVAWGLYLHLDLLALGVLEEQLDPGLAVVGGAFELGELVSPQHHLQGWRTNRQLGLLSSMEKNKTMDCFSRRRCSLGQSKEGNKVLETYWDMMARPFKHSRSFSKTEQIFYETRATMWPYCHSWCLHL